MSSKKQIKDDARAAALRANLQRRKAKAKDQKAEQETNDDNE